VQATGRRISEGWCRRRHSNKRGGGICNKKVGFACSLTDRAGPYALFSRPESPTAPRDAGDGLGSIEILGPILVAHIRFQKFLRNLKAHVCEPM
jgi:hypothetical protein